MTSTLIEQRLSNQGLTQPRHRRAADVVEWLGAVQAQEYEPAKWGLGQRMKDGGDAAVEREFEQGRILRTHVMRPTWHFVAAADIRWMQMLTAPRVLRTLATYDRRMELDTPTRTRATRIFERVLRDHQYLTRAELGDRLRRSGLTISGMRLAFAAAHAELRAVICSGPRRGKHSTYALVAERAPNARELSRDEALAELTRRFFRSHGPATVRDFVWWSGLPTADARRGLEINRAERQTVDGYTYWTVGSAGARAPNRAGVCLLPVYDEYVVAYRDRTLVPHGPSKVAAGAGQSVTFQHALVIAGRIAGTWRITRGPRAVSIAVTPLRRLTASEKSGVAAAALRYERFLGIPIVMRT